MKNFEYYSNDGMHHLYKIYNDGGHFVGTKVTLKDDEEKKTRFVKEKDDIDYLFDALYVYCIENNITGNKMYEYIYNEFTITNEIVGSWVSQFIKDKIKQKINNFHKRVKRFKRKAHLNTWNYFVTFTYDDKKQTEESFRKKLRKCLANLHTRKGWKYMGVYEKGADNERLHFHCLLYVPAGEMVGEIFEQKRYSTKRHKVDVIYNNTFFQKRFGDADFKQVNCNEMTINYILKYLHKSNEKIVYSRSIPTEIIKEICDDDIATEFLNFVVKYVFYDDVIDYQSDVIQVNGLELLSP